MPRYEREDAWRDLEAGGVFRLPGVRAKRFRFLAVCTNLANGDRFVEAVDIGSGRLRFFPLDAEVVKDRRASSEAARRRAAHDEAVAEHARASGEPAPKRRRPRSRGQGSGLALEAPPTPAAQASPPAVQASPPAAAPPVSHPRRPRARPVPVYESGRLFD